jgi:hypothetical protein
MPDTSHHSTIRVDFNGHDGWAVALSDPDAQFTCETLDDARRIAFVQAAQRPRCELVICDAYHRVLEREQHRSPD